jgi:hypothetical protein
MKWEGSNIKRYNNNEIWHFTGIAKHLNELNVELQGKQNLMPLYDNNKNFQTKFWF